MGWFFAGVTFGLLLVALRDEFRPGGSLHMQLRTARAETTPPIEYAEVGLVDGTTFIVSPRGVEIPVGRLSAQEIVVALADIDRAEEFEVA